MLFFIFTVLFNKCALKGDVFNESKHGKVVCLSKDGLYPEENRLRPISLLPNIRKWYKRCVYEQISNWCNENNVFVDEQSGFTANRRLETRILTLCEDLRLTISACNLIYLEMPLGLVRWIYQRLQGRTMAVHSEESKSKMIKFFSGAPQGSVLSATLFRLHTHSLPRIFARFCCHLFADNVALVIKGAIENRLSKIIDELEKQAAITMKIQEKFRKDLLLTVNIKKKQK